MEGCQISIIKQAKKSQKFKYITYVHVCMFSCNYADDNGCDLKLCMSDGLLGLENMFDLNKGNL